MEPDSPVLILFTLIIGIIVGTLFFGVIGAVFGGMAAVGTYMYTVKETTEANEERPTRNETAFEE